MALRELKGFQPPDNTDANRCSPLLIHEGVILSTCNRLEIYAVVENKDAGWRTLEDFLTQFHNVQTHEIEPHLYRYEGKDAVHHLMRVACGLDSMILGEPQILGQVSQAFSAAQAANFTGPVLSHLFFQAIHAGKWARSDTDISRFTTSISHAAAQMLLEKVSVQTPNILIVGAGEIARLGAKSLRKYSQSQIAFINRTPARAELLAAEFGGQSVGWDQLGEALHWADAVFTATSAPHIVITKHTVEQALARRNGRPLFFVDIAVPRDVEASVDTLNGVIRYDIDDLHFVVDTNTAQRQAAIPQVERIIENEVSSFFDWYHSREVTPVITHLRRRAQEVAQLEIEQALNKLGDVDEHTTQVINQLAHRIVNKILHEPTVRLRGQAAEGNGYGYAHAVSELFGLYHNDYDLQPEPVDDANKVIPDISSTASCIGSAQQSQS